MLEREVKVGGIYRHFKGTFHKVICIAKDSETLEDKVVYTHEDTCEFWVRDMEEFLSEVDHKKYPDIKQKYRFELIDDSNSE
jgi:hypothetical protein